MDLAAGGSALGGSDKMGVGVDIGELSSKGMDVIARALVDWNANVFVDTGAFRAFRRKPSRVAQKNSISIRSWRSTTS